MRHPAGAGAARRLAEYVTFFVLVGLGVAALHLRRRFDLVQVNSLVGEVGYVPYGPVVCWTRTGTR